MSKENYGNNEFDFDNILKEFGSLPDEPVPQPPVFEPDKKRIRFETQDDGSDAALIVSIEKPSEPSEPEDDPLMAEVLGPHIYAQFIAGKKKEWEEYCTRVSSWEIAKYMVMY